MYRKINTPLQHTFCSMEFFLQIDIILQLFTITTWFISASNNNQPTFGINQMELYGPLNLKPVLAVFTLQARDSILQYKKCVYL